MLTFFLNNLWRWKCNLPEKDSKVDSIEQLKISEWSDTFEKLMRNTLIMGSIRYGKLHAKNKPKYNRVASIKNKIKLYEETGNKELLVDIAAICLVEFEECNHPKAHFYATDDKQHITFNL